MLSLNTYLIYAKPTFFFFFPAWIWQLWLWVMSLLLYWYVSLNLETLKCAYVMLIKIYMAYVVLIVINFRLLRNVTAWLWLWAPGWGSLQCLQWHSTDTRIHPWYVQVLTHHSQHPEVLILIPVCCHVLHKHLNQTFQSWQKWQRWREVNSGLFVSCSVIGSGADVEPARGEAPCPAPVALLAVPGPRWHCGEDKTCLTTGEQQLSWGLWQLLTDLSGYCDVL